MDSITFHTLESNFVLPTGRPTAVPYLRVMGITSGSGIPIELWTTSGRGSGDNLEYERQHTSPVSFTVPNSVSEKIIEFYRRFYVEAAGFYENLEQTGESSKITERHSTNCHRFGYWMRGRHVAFGDKIPPAPDYIAAEGFRSSPNFREGQHAVLGNGSAIHSVVGLGLDSDRCLQVLSCGGPMAIDTYENVVDYYDPVGDRNLGFYV